jgi:hypothetical protein
MRENRLIHGHRWSIIWFWAQWSTQLNLEHDKTAEYMKHVVGIPEEGKI